LIAAGDTNATIARFLEEKHGFITTGDSLRRFRQRHELNIPGTEPAYTRIVNDDAECMMEPRSGKPILSDPDTMLRQRGLDPEEWYIAAITVNEWDGLQKGGLNKTKLYQTKFTAKRKCPELILTPPRADGWTPTKRVRLPMLDDPELVVICGDYQAPFYDKNLHRLFCEWLAYNTPERAVDLGDLMDFPDLGRHPDDPYNVAYAQECLQSGYEIRRDQVAASPGTVWQWMPGNHDIRLHTYLVKNAPRAAMIRRVDTDRVQGEIVNDVSFLTRSDELGVEYIDPRGPYELAQIQLSKNLAVRHGWLVRAKGGETAYKSLEKTGYSILVGHTHRQAIVQHTVSEIDGGLRQLLAAEIGCMCRVDAHDRDEGGRVFPSYTPMPDWQQGFTTAMLWKDGRFKVDLATYVNGTLLWQGQRFE
jgi:hypothetical protein